MQIRVNCSKNYKQYYEIIELNYYGEIMDNWENILDENILKYNVSFAAIFVLNYECLKDYVINQVRDFYSDNVKWDGDNSISEETAKYKKEVRSLDKNIENASLMWFLQLNVITEDDFEKYQVIRKRRNDITHELLKNLNDGFTENDAKLLGDMLEIYNKIDKWRINEIKIPIAGNDIPEDYDRDGVCGVQAMILSIINSIVLGNKGAEYKEILDKLNEILKSLRSRST